MVAARGAGRRGGGRPGPGLAEAAPPLRGTTTADIAIVGGGYTGLWTAIRIAEQAPGARIVLLEADICGGGPSGRNGGFATGWWDELPTLIERHGPERAVAAAQAIDDAVDEIGRWCDANGVDAWYTKRGTLSVSAAPAQDDKWQEAVAACRDAGFGDRYVALDRRGGAGARRLAGAARGRVHARRRDDPAGDPRPRPAPGRPRARRRHPRGDPGRGARRRAPGLARQPRVPAAGERRPARTGRPVRIRDDVRRRRR